MRLAALVGLLLALAAPARADDLHARLGVVCLHALESPYRTWPNLDAWFEQFFAFELKRSGHELRTPKQVAEVADAVRRELRVFDPHTGVRNAVAPDDLQRAVAAALTEKLGCTSQLKPAVELVRAHWRGGIASWDGSARWMGGSWDAFGTIGALSARAEFFDAQSALVHRGYGGIRTTSKLDNGSFFDTPEFRGVEESKLLTSLLWNVDGFRRAFGPLASAPTDTEIECVRAAREKDVNERRAEKQKGPVTVSRHEALAWLQPRSVFGEGWGMSKSWDPGVEPDAAATLADCILESFDYEPVEERKPKEDDSAQGAAADTASETPSNRDASAANEADPARESADAKAQPNGDASEAPAPPSL